MATRKDFQAIADAIRECPALENETLRHAVALDIARGLRGTNANFNLDKFMTACDA